MGKLPAFPNLSAASTKARKRAASNRRECVHGDSSGVRKRSCCIARVLPRAKQLAYFTVGGRVQAAQASQVNTCMRAVTSFLCFLFGGGTRNPGQKRFGLQPVGLFSQRLVSKRGFFSGLSATNASNAKAYRVLVLKKYNLHQSKAMPKSILSKFLHSLESRMFFKQRQNLEFFRNRLLAVWPFFHLVPCSHDRCLLGPHPPGKQKAARFLFWGDFSCLASSQSNRLQTGRFKVPKRAKTESP